MAKFKRRPRFTIRHSAMIATQFIRVGKQQGNSGAGLATILGMSTYQTITRWASGATKPWVSNFNAMVDFLNAPYSLRGEIKKAEVQKAVTKIKAETETDDFFAPDLDDANLCKPPEPAPETTDDVDAYIDLFSQVSRASRWAIVHALLKTLEGESN